MDFKVQTNLPHIDIQIYDHALTLHFKIHADWINWVSPL